MGESALLSRSFSFFFRGPQLLFVLPLEVAYIFIFYDILIALINNIRLKYIFILINFIIFRICPEKCLVYFFS